jgi:putative oxidoreductase
MKNLMSHPMMKKCFTPDMGLFFIRLAVAIVFIVHGWQKFQAMDQTIMFFGTLGLAPFFAYLVATVELVGGIMVLLGVFGRIASAFLVIVMIFAIALVKAKMGFPAIEIDIMLLGSNLGLVMLGSGKWSLVQGHSCECCDKCDETCTDGTCCSMCKPAEMKCDGCEGCKDKCSMHEGK